MHSTRFKTFVLKSKADLAFRRATGSININITEIDQLGEEWNSSTLTTVFDRLASPSKNANVGEITGNRMFFANDYMVCRTYAECFDRT